VPSPATKTAVASSKTVVKSQNKVPDLVKKWGMIWDPEGSSWTMTNRSNSCSNHNKESSGMIIAMWRDWIDL